MVSSYQKKKQLPNHCLPQPEEEGKIPSIFSHKLTIHMLMHFFSHLLNKSKMLAHNQTHANLHKLLTADVGVWKQGQEWMEGGYWCETQLLSVFCYPQKKLKLSQFIRLIWVALAE